MRQFLVWGLIVTALLLLQVDRASAQQVMACPTIVDAVDKDWRATEQLYNRGMGAYETNGVIRAIGPGLYFPPIIVVAAISCRENRQWRYASILVWAVQTVAVNSHTRIGTFSGAPILYLGVRF